MAEVLSVCVGQPTAVKAFDAKGIEHTVVTGIFKEPVEGRVLARTLGLEGDAQADTRVVKGGQVHGGVEKAVYLYPAAHYALWQQELARDLPFGQFGENLTVTGLDEETVRVGDTLRVGEALFQVTTPRGPCFKLDIRMGIPEFRNRMDETGRTGFYVRVLEEGTVGAGDAVEVVSSDAAARTILECHFANLDRGLPIAGST